MRKDDKASAAIDIGLGISCEWLKFTAAFVTALGRSKGGAQTTPSTISNKTWASDAPSSWFTAENWNPGIVPTTADDVGVGSVSTAQIAEEGAAVTLGVVNIGADGSG